MPRKKKAKGEKSVKEITRCDSLLFPNRLTGKDIEIQGLTFSIKALEAPITAYIYAQITDESGKIDKAAMSLLFTKYGVTQIANGKIVYGADWPKQKFATGSFQHVPDKLLNEFLPGMLFNLFREIQTLTHLSGDEKDRLDFTSDSDMKKSEKDVPKDACSEVESPEIDPAGE